MDQVALVKEQIIGGRELVTRLQAGGLPLTAACWARTENDSQWYLYLVSSVADEEGVRPGYRKVRETIRQLDGEGWDEFERVDPMDVKLVGLSDPVARALAFEYEPYPGPSPTHHHGSVLGRNLPIDGAYIYPATLFAAPAAPPG